MPPQSSILLNALRRATGVRTLVVLAVCMTLITGSTLSGAASSRSLSDPALDSVTVTDEDGYTKVAGESAGALYELLRPDDWNGRLILLLHGQVPASQPVELPPFGHNPLWSALIDRLVTDGYGVAYSSYRITGFAVAEGMLDSRIAQAKFTAAFGAPEETYLMGFSMGTHIGQKLVETSPARYDGYLAVCSALGGTTLQFEYFSNARILFDYYFPGVLPGNVWSKTDLDFGGIVIPAVVNAITASPESFQRAVELAGINQLAIPWTTPDELIIGIAMAMGPAGGGTGDLQAKTGGVPIDNSGTYYTGSSDDEALNAGVGRFEADPNAVQYFQRFDPTGKLHGTPVYALHTRDPSVRHQFHFRAYEAVLAEAGNEHLFATRIIDRFGHCALTADEIFDALQDLESWAGTGIPPQQ